MSSESDKIASQTDGKAGQPKKSEMGMMAYKVKIIHRDMLVISLKMCTLYKLT